MPKLSIYLPDDVHAALGQPENVSGRIAHIVRAYEAVVVASLPDFTLDQWHALVAHYRHTYPNDGANLKLLWAGVEGDGQLPEAAALAQQLKSMPFASLVAVQEVLMACANAKPSRLDGVLLRFGIAADTCRRAPVAG